VKKLPTINPSFAKKKKNFSNILAKGETQEMFKTISDKKKKHFCRPPPIRLVVAEETFRRRISGSNPGEKN
jgi:hypothetical protein